MGQVKDPSIAWNGPCPPPHRHHHHHRSSTTTDIIATATTTSPLAQVQQQELMAGAASVAAVVVATLLLCYRKKWRRDPREHLAGLSHTQKAMLTRQSGADDDASGGGGGGADGSGGVATSSEQEQLKAKYIAAIEASEAGWAMEAPAHSDENLKAWHRPEGGSIHSFKYEVIMPFEPTPLICTCVRAHVLLARPHPTCMYAR